MKRAWTRGEKWLWAAPLLLGVIALGIKLSPEAYRRSVGSPPQLGTTATNTLKAVVLSRDGSILAASGLDIRTKVNPTSGTVYLWDPRSLRPLKPLAPQHWKDRKDAFGISGYDPKSLSLSPDGKLVGISGRGAPGYAVYEVATQRLLWRTTTSSEHAEFSRDGRIVALGQFEIREARNGKLVARWKSGTSNGSVLKHFSLSPDGMTVAWIGDRKSRSPLVRGSSERPPEDKAIEIRRLNDGKVLRVLSDSQHTETVSFSPDGNKIISLAWGPFYDGGTDGSVVRCHAKSGQLLWQRDFRKPNTDWTSRTVFWDAKFSPDGKEVALLQSIPKKALLLLDASTGVEEQQLELPSAQGTNFGLPPALAFSPDGERLFARGKDAVVVFDLPHPL